MPTDRPLTSEERASLTDFIKQALKRIGADRASSPHPDKLQELISQAIDLYRQLDKPRRNAGLLDASVSLGTLWGQVICDQLGWTWAFLKLDETNEVYGIVPTDRSYLVFPMHHIKNLLLDAAREQDSLRLYEELKAGSLPASSARAYLVIGSTV